MTGKNDLLSIQHNIFPSPKRNIGAIFKGMITLFISVLTVSLYAQDSAPSKVADDAFSKAMEAHKLATTPPKGNLKYQNELAERENRLSEIRKKLKKVPLPEEAASPANQDVFSCEARREYIRKKIKNSETPVQLLKKIAKKSPKIILFGDVHDVRDFSAWIYNINVNMDKIDPSYDCFFSEGEPDIRQDNYHEFLIKNLSVKSKDMALLKRYAEERGLPFKVNGEEVTMGFIQTRLSHLRKFRREFAIDDRTDWKDVDRDLFMTTYVKDLFDRKVCKKAIAFLGRGHLRPQKWLYKRMGIDAVTVGFSTLNDYNSEYRIEQFEKKPGEGKSFDVTTPNVFDIDGCAYVGDRPTKPIAFFTNDEKAPDLLTPSKRDFFKYRWNSFDAIIAGPTFDRTQNPFESAVNFFKK
jgi:hypothetical protein